MEDLSQYLLSRGLVLDPVAIDKHYDPVMEDEAVLQEVAEIWATHEKALGLVIQARVNAIGRVILEKAIPQETIVLRQSLVEVGAIGSDLEKYKREWERRKSQAETPEKEEEKITAETPPAQTSQEGGL